MRDGQGLTVTVSDDAAVSAYNRSVTEWLDYKITAMRTLKQVIEIEPEFVEQVHFLDRSGRIAKYWNRLVDRKSRIVGECVLEGVEEPFI